MQQIVMTFENYLKQAFMFINPPSQTMKQNVRISVVIA